MAAGDTDIGTGSTITFAGYSAEVLDISWSGISREAIDISHMGTTGGRAFKPGDLYDPGEITVEYHFKSTAAPPMTATADTITITFPDLADWSAQGFMTGFEFHDPLEDKMTARATFKITGAISF